MRSEMQGAGMRRSVWGYISLLGPALLVSIGSMDPGNWATSIDSGSRFGCDLVWVLLLASLIALLLRSLSARLGLVSGKHLAQACHDEYPSGVCFLLWFFSELSLVILDSAMVLSSAVGLNLMLGLPVIAGVFLVAVDVLFLMSLLPFLGAGKAEALLGAMVLPAVFSFVLNALLTRPSLRPVLGGLWPRMKSDSIYAVVGLFGANIMPHNLFLNSALVQEQRGQSGSHGLSDFILTGGLPIVVNLAVMIVSAKAFHNAGFAILTLQDGYVVMEQVFSHGAAPPAFGLALICAGLSSTLAGTMAAQASSEGLLGRRLDAWIHRILMRAAAVLIATTCAWTSGNEGVYQMLVLSQAVLALQLPFTLIPLIRLTSSTAYMGKDKISLLLEVLAWLVLAFIISLDLCFVFWALFTQSEEFWEGSTNWDISAGSDSNTFAVPVTLTVVTIVVGFLVWLVFTPIRSDTQNRQQKEFFNRAEEISVSEAVVAELTPPIAFSTYKDVDNNARVNVFSEPEAVSEVLDMRLEDSDSSVEDADSSAEKDAEKVFTGQDLEEEVKISDDTVREKSEAPDVSATEECIAESVPCSFDGAEASEAALPFPTKALLEKDVEKYEEEAEGCWEQEGDLLSSPCGKIDPAESAAFGSEGGSLSRQSGLGRAARRQFATILEEFWSRLFDYHGQPVGVKSNSSNLSEIQDSIRRRESLLKFSNHPVNPLGRTHSSLSASTSHSGRWLSDCLGRPGYGGDQRYSSLRNFSYHEDMDSQPATIHGYNIASRARAGSLQVDLGDFMPKSGDSGASSGDVMFSTNKVPAAGHTVDRYIDYDSAQWSSFPTESVDRWNPLVYRATGELEKTLPIDRAPLSFDDISPSQTHRHGFSIQAASHTNSLWSRQPFEQLFGAPGDRQEKAASQRKRAVCSLSNGVEFDVEVLWHLRLCVRKLLQLEGSEWLFRVENGCDEDLIAGVAGREKLMLESEQSQANVTSGCCGDACVWESGLLVSFGVWCVHRVLELALIESRPELWGKYTYVLNRLQGIVEPAFFSSPTRTVLQPCICLEGSYQVLANGRQNAAGGLSNPWSWGRNASNVNGRPASSSVYLDMIKEVENAVGSRKGRTGTAAGDIAFPKGKENLASVLKRYKRRLGNKTANGCNRRSSC